ncbi:MAG: endonuclease III [Planctomycetia bacterium]|nr:endonuclease III [Planctomycetia bacterium]
MKKYGTKRHANNILAQLDIMYPAAACALTYESPLQLLISTILSAQCTDIRVNMVTPALFKKYKTAADFAAASQESLEMDIRSTGFYHNKAKNIRACCKILAEKFEGQVPQDMKTLVSLPGIGRKTANCVLGNAYGLSEGITVDTHVLRLSQRIGLSTSSTPEKVETDLMKIIPRDKWILVSHQLIFLGRELCHARKPKCEICPISECKNKKNHAS